MKNKKITKLTEQKPFLAQLRRIRHRRYPSIYGIYPPSENNLGRMAYVSISRKVVMYETCQKQSNEYKFKLLRDLLFDYREVETMEELMEGDNCYDLFERDKKGK